MRPLSGSMRRLIMRSVVVLPQPDGPIRTHVWSSGISSVRFSTALEPLAKRLLTFSRRITARLTYRNDGAGIPGVRGSVDQLGLAVYARALGSGPARRTRRADPHCPRHR